MQFPQPVAVHHWPFGPFLLEKSVATNRSIRGNLSPPAYWDVVATARFDQQHTDIWVLGQSARDH
jgi:hypothetical protein